MRFFEIGLLEVIAELFVLNAFLLDTLITHEKEKCYQYNKNVLKYIGNSLTNLTFEVCNVKPFFMFL